MEFVMLTRAGPTQPCTRASVLLLGDDAMRQWTEAVPPHSQGLVTNFNPAFEQQVLHVPRAQGILHVHHHHQADHLGHLAEIGVIAAQGPVNARALADLLRRSDASIAPAVATALLPLVTQLEHLDAEIKEADAAIARLAKADPVASALMSIPGIGPVTASALVASVGDPSGFSGPRQFAAFLGLVPRQNSSGGKPRLGRISKMGNAYLRKLLVVGAHAVLYHCARHADPLRCWAQKLMETEPFKLVAVAVANKLARIVFAVMTTGTSYRAAKA